MDLEMTGLDPARNTIVEVATVITDDDLEIVAEGPDLVLAASEEQLAGMDEVVRTMHQRSGLLEAIRASHITLEEAGQATLAFLSDHIPEPGTVPLCGNSIGTDRRFLQEYLPDVETWFHYRNVDVSTVKELVRRWRPEVLASAPEKQSTHRAMEDVLASVAELRHYRTALFGTSSAESP
jgi:oligoribonuclease